LIFLAFKDGTLARKAAKEGIEIPKSEKDWIQEVEIDAISPESLIKKFDGKKIDLLAVDTEGFDFEILKMLDLKAMNPEVIIYEEEHFNEKTKEDCKGFFNRSWIFLP
jgi:hypothetical protein